MATLKDAIKGQLAKTATAPEGDSRDSLITAMCSLLSILLNQIEDKETESDELPTEEDIYAKPIINNKRSKFDDSRIMNRLNQMEKRIKPRTIGTN